MTRSLPILLAPLLALAATTACQPDLDQQIAKGREAYAARRYGEVRELLSPILLFDPANAEAGLLAARAALALGDGDAAQATLAALPAAKRPVDYAMLVAEAALFGNHPDRALTALGNAGSATAERLRALALIGKDQPAPARAAFERGLALRPLDARLAADFARFKLGTHDTAGARGLIDAALAADPRAIEVLLVKAQYATATGDTAGALDAYDRALKLYPGNIAAIAGKAGVLGDLGRTGEMQAELAKTGGATGRNPELAFIKARAAVAQNDWRGARDILQANAAGLRDNEAAAVLNAEVLVHLGQVEQARALLVPVLTRSPGNVLARRELAKIQLAQHDGKAAADTLAPLVGKPTSAPEDQRAYAAAAHLAGRPDAQAAEADARFPRPQWLAANLALADTAMRAGRWTEASAIYVKILGVTDGTNPLVLNNLAFAQSRLGNRAKALSYAERALTFAPGNPSIMDTVGQLLIETHGDRGRALSLLRRAAQAAPQNIAIRDHLALAEKAA